MMTFQNDIPMPESPQMPILSLTDDNKINSNFSDQIGQIGSYERIDSSDQISNPVWINPDAPNI